MGPAKRPGDDVHSGLSTPLHKASRTDLHGEYAALGGGGGGGGGKRRSNAASAASNGRTGQACDRCKVRKIRCDARPGGCSPCLQNNTECTTTDRISGAARSRGHTERLENENSALKMYVSNLQQQLREHKIEPVGQPPVLPGFAPVLSQAYYPEPREHSASWGSVPNNDYAAVGPLNLGERNGSQGQLLSEFRHGCIGDNYLGVSAGNSWLSPIEGSSLSLFGAKVDLSEYMPSEESSPNSGISYASFIDHAFGGVKVDAPPLPPWETTKMYGDWYFRSIQPFIPVLHKRDFMHMIHRIYHENYHTTTAETVMLHVVIAMVNYQSISRNGDSSSQHNWAHWQYAISFVPELIKGHTLEDMQALVLICAQLRALTRPGAAWMFTNSVLGMAIELGLHRSVSAWQGSADKDARMIEMRQRTFWSIIVIHVNISGKLGRPMPMRLEDFDIEIPECTHDNLPEEDDLNEWRKCSWRAGRYGFELTRVMMKVYSSIYAIRSPTALYESHVRQLSKELKGCVATFPAQLAGGEQTKNEDRVSALYLELSVQSCQLLIHHPAISRQPSPEIMNYNLDACLEAAGKMLSVSLQLNMLKSLDYTLYFNMDNLAAIFTTLFAHSERRDSMSLADLQRLRQEMQQWLEIMGCVGSMMGSGNRLRSAISNIIEWSIGTMHNHIVAKTASAAVVASTSTSSGDATPQPTPFYRNNSTSFSASNPSPSAADYEIPAPSHPATSAVPFDQQQQSFGVYPDPALNYTSAPFGYSAEDVKPNIEAQLAHAALSQTAPHHQQAAQHQPQPHQPHQPHQANSLYAQYQSGNGATFAPSHVPGSVAWRTFAEGVVSNMVPDGMTTPTTNINTAPTNNMAAFPGAVMVMNGAQGNGVGVGGGNGGGYAAAGFGEMQMPASHPGSGGMESESWPLIHYGQPQ